MSRTEDSLPPYSAGIPPLIIFISFIASALNTEKNPKRCAALYTTASSSSIKF
jgi:hypothetical protein